MIDLYYDKTPNGRKALIALEELNIPYEIHWIDVKHGQQFEPQFTTVNPNSKIPAIVDHDGPEGQPIRLFESGAILMYLAEKTGRLMPDSSRERWEATCWIFWQLANQGPAAGNAAHFVQYAPSAGIVDEYAKSRYLAELRRCCRVLDEQLEERSYLVGNEFSMADIVCFPWTRVLRGVDVDISDYPNLSEWSNRIAQRPSAKVKPDSQGHDLKPPTNLDSQSYSKLFGVDPAAVGTASEHNDSKQEGRL